MSVMDGPENAILFAKDPYAITKPTLITIGGYCVRDFQVHNLVDSKPAALPAYEENDDMVSCMEVEDNFDIRITRTGKFLIQFHVAPSFNSRIIGTKGLVRRQIELDTRTSIKIPRQNEAGDIVITGGNERDVISAKNRIDIIVWEARDKQPITHFLSIPMVSDMIKHNFDIFKTNLLTGTLVRGLDASMFQNPNKLHLTIATLVLADDVEQSDAIKTLKQCKEEVVNPILATMEPLQVTMKGVEIMNDDPTNVDVLYGKVVVNPPKYNDSFQKLADGIVDCFVQKGLIRRQYQSVKLHVTLINSLFRKTADVQGNPKNAERKQKREPFDATRILEKHKNFYFGDVNLKFVHLSVRFTTSQDSYFEALHTIALT